MSICMTCGTEHTCKDVQMMAEGWRKAKSLTAEAVARAENAESLALRVASAGCASCGKTAKYHQCPDKVSEAVAKEAARWREAMQIGVDAILSQTSIACVIHREGDFPCDECGQCLRVKARRIMITCLNSSSSDWLARHDAELLRPWREAIKMASEYQEPNWDLIPSNFAKEAEKEYDEMHKVFDALLSQTRAPKQCECLGCQANNRVGPHPAPSEVKS